MRSFPESKMVWGLEVEKSTRLLSNGKKGGDRVYERASPDPMVPLVPPGNSLSWEETWVLIQRWDASQ